MSVRRNGDVLDNSLETTIFRRKRTSRATL
jgi:hypothetical protein